MANRVELVVVATGALDGHREERGARGVDHVFKTFIFIFLRVVRLVVPGSQSQEAGGDQRVVGTVGKFVAGELFEDEPVERQVVVEGADDPVAILPRERLGLVAFVARGLGVARDVEPVTSPALAELGRGEEFVDELFVGIGIRVIVERVNRFGAWRDADEVNRHAANQSPLVGLGGGLPAFFVELATNQDINGIRVGDFGLPDRLKRPPIASGAGLACRLEAIETPPAWPGRALTDPIAEARDFGVGEFLALALLLGWHLSF